jgi:hypothetical protein
MSELVQRLRPRWTTDQVFSRAVRAVRSAGDDALAEELNQAIVANNALKDEAADALEQAERVELHARAMTKALTGLTANGSEFFVRIGESYYADIDACVTYIRERQTIAHTALAEAIKERKAALSRAEQAERNYEALVSRVEDQREIYGLMYQTHQR